VRDAGALQATLQDMVEKIRWLMEHECFPLSTMPRWQEVVADADEMMGKIDAVVAGAGKLLDSEHAAEDTQPCAGRSEHVTAESARPMTASGASRKIIKATPARSM
jgi:hypothetical protein